MKTGYSKIGQFLAGALLLCLAIYGLDLFLRHEFAQESIRMQRFELKNVLKGWLEDGQPEDEALRDYVRTNFSWRIVVSNRSFTINGTNFETIFATTNLMSPGTLFITTNEVFILIQENSNKPQIIPW